MKRKSFKLLSILVVAVLFNTLALASNTQIPEPYILKDSTQLVVVTTKGWNSPTGIMQRYIRKSPSDAWKRVGGASKVVVGKNGLGWSGEWNELKLAGPYKKEHDQKAPAGVFELGPAFGFAPKSKTKTKLYYLPIISTTICVDDPNSHFYGRIIDAAKVSKKDWKSGEKMRNFQQYQMGVVVGYNMGERIPGIGSCIFLHVLEPTKEATVGCTAMPKKHMASLIVWLDPNKNPVLVQMPKAQYHKLQPKWGLPKV